MTAFLALAGLSYVYLTLQLYHLGERKKAARERAYQSAHSKRYSQRADRGFDLALGVATPIERRLPENDPDFGSKHRPADYSSPVTGRRHDPARS